MLILILLNRFLGKSSSVPLAILFSVIYLSSAEKSGIVVLIFKEIELHSEISFIS
jgi:hypothetical protein